MNNIDNNLWQEINNMFISSNRQLVLNSDELEYGIKSLDVLQVTSKSALGSIILNTSGIVIDNWIRILGHDSNINRGILSYNSIRENRVVFESGRMDKAKEYFTIANKKSCGRCFEEDDIKYKEFFINEVIKKGN